jgi:hypothetical protein
MGKRKIFSMLLVVALIVSMFTNAFLFGPLIIFSKADPGDINEDWHNETTLNVTVLQLQPRINWYDFQYNQSGTWVSKLNTQIDVNNSAEYRFIVNISSDQGWADIEYINTTVWFDNGNEGTTYNNSGNLGGNLNMYLQYENTTGTASYYMLWPDDEVTFSSGDCTEAIVTDPGGSPGNTECHNLTFPFTPGYQFRYAPGDGIWDTNAGHNDTWSWNFNITVEDQSGYKSYDNPIVGETIDEFGIYSYTEVTSAGWPVIVGNPGDSPAYNQSYINIETRSNGNYSLSVNVTNLTHTSNPSYIIQNTSILTAGGELNPLTLFNGNNPQYYYGGAASYTSAENNGTILTTSDAEWAVNIPIGQQPGDYNATIYYHLRTQT